HWQGKIDLQTDLFGRLRFPQCDWSIALWSKGKGRDAVCSQQRICGFVTRRDVRLAWPGRPHDELLVMTRDEWLRMMVANADRLDCRQIVWPQGDVGLRLQFANQVPGWHVRYDPVVMGDGDYHAGLTGGLVAAVLG